MRGAPITLTDEERKQLMKEVDESGTRVTQDDIDWAIGQIAIIERDRPKLHQVEPGETLRKAIMRRAQERAAALDELVEIAQKNDMGY